MTVYFLLIVTVILRFELPYQYFVWARRLYAITLTMLFLRFMQTYYVEKNMGPKVIMIKKMVSDSSECRVSPLSLCMYACVCVYVLISLFYESVNEDV